MVDKRSGAEMRDIMKERMVPILSDQSLRSHILAWRLFFKYGVTSFLCGSDHFLSTSLDPVCRFLRLNRSEDRLAAEQLADFVESYEDCLFFLIPMNEEDRRLTTTYSALLESRLIVSDPWSLLSGTPFANCH